MKPLPQFNFTLDMGPFLRFGMVAGIFGILVPLYFRITRKKAYEEAVASARKNGPTT
jgi:hypothetical protein